MYHSIRESGVEVRFPTSRTSVLMVILPVCEADKRIPEFEPPPWRSDFANSPPYGTVLARRTPRSLNWRVGALRLKRRADRRSDALLRQLPPR
jgi:hypothetical protein